MECTHCHRELKSDWNFCPDCGGLIDEVSALLQDHGQKDRLEDPDDYPMDFDPALYDL